MQVELFRNSKVYVNEARHHVIMLKYETHKDWKKMASEILVEIYGENLKYMSAKGTRGSIGVDPRIFGSLYGELISSDIWYIKFKI